LTHRDWEGEQVEHAGAPVTCDGCGHRFRPLSFSTTVGDDVISIEVPGPVTCPQCGAEIGA
jgi:hypothetical protein